MDSSVNVMVYVPVVVMVLLLLAATIAVVMGFIARSGAGPEAVSSPIWQLVALAAIVSLLWVVFLTSFQAFAL